MNTNIADRQSVPRRLAGRLRRVNRAVGLFWGGVLLIACAAIIIEIVMQKVAFGVLGGTDEISGYVMAGLASWAGAYALIEKAHIRIDLAHRRLPKPAQTALDVLSLSGLLCVAIAILIYGARLLDRSWTRASASNTPLETPLWIPQAIWLSGWLWFALSAAVLLVLTIWAAALRDWAGASEIAGPEPEDAAFAATPAIEGRAPR